jgi:hypothetical protein
MVVIRKGFNEQRLFQTNHALGILIHGDEFLGHSMDWSGGQRHGVGRRSSASPTHTAASGSESVS